MSKAQLLKERQARIFKAIDLEKPDRVPVVLEYAGFAAHVTNKPLAVFLGSISKSVDVMIEAFHIVGEADGIDYGSYSPYSLAYGWMSKVKVAGVELPDDAMYQVVEAELMKIEDYDRILHEGWRDFYRLFMQELEKRGIIVAETMI